MIHLLARVEKDKSLQVLAPDLFIDDSLKLTQSPSWTGRLDALRPRPENVPGGHCERVIHA